MAHFLDTTEGPAPGRRVGAARARLDALVTGIDLGGTKIRAGIADADGRILADLVRPTPRDEAPLLARIAEMVDDLARAIDAPRPRISATGIGGAGVPTGDGTGLTLAPNLAGVDARPFATRLSETLGHPVVLDNDVNVAALGELHHGLGREHPDFVFVSVGTGIGMGVVIDGRLVRGAHRAAGEIGFLPFGTDPLAPENQRRGALEEAVAGDALARTYLLATGERATPAEIFTRASDGDAAAARAVEAEARWIASALVATASILDPEIFVLGGGIGGRTDFAPAIERWARRLGSRRLDIRHSALGSRAPVAGAVHLALNSLASAERESP